MSNPVAKSKEEQKLDEGQEPKLYGPELIRKHGFWKILKEDLRAQKQGYRVLLQPGFQAIAVYRFGTWIKLQARWLRLLMRIPYLVAFIFVRNVYGIEIKDTSLIGRRFRIGHQNGIVLHMWGTYGDDCTIRQNVTFGVGVEFEGGRGPVIGDRVQFGPGVVVIGNITIGDDVIVGPNCVVTSDVPAKRTLFVAPPRVFPIGDQASLNR